MVRYKQETRPVGEDGVGASHPESDEAVAWFDYGDSGGTEWQGRFAMRISVSSWATTDADIELSLEAMLRCAAQA